MDIRHFLNYYLFVKFNFLSRKLVANCLNKLFYQQWCYAMFFYAIAIGFSMLYLVMYKSQSETDAGVYVTV